MDRASAFAEAVGQPRDDAVAGVDAEELEQPPPLAAAAGVWLPRSPAAASNQSASAAATSSSKPRWHSTLK